MSLDIKKLVHIFYYSLILIILDLALHIFVKSSSYSFIHIITYDIFIGVTFFTLLSINNKTLRKIIFVFINIIITFYALIILIQIFGFRSFSNLYPIKIIIMNTSYVFRIYKKDLLMVIKNNLLIFIISIFALISEIYISKKIYLSNDIIINNKEKYLIIILTGLLALFGIANINDNIIDWASNVKVNGLKAAIANEYITKDNLVFDFDEDIKEKQEEDNEEISTITYNTLDFDFDELINNEKREEYNKINKYIKSKAPTEKNSYTGLFEGKNLIMICAEAFNSCIVDEELFPTIYRLVNNGFKLNNFYQPQGASSTSSGEYAFTTGMIPTSNDLSFMESASNDMGFTVSKKLKNLGYNTYSFHNAYLKFYGRDLTHTEHMGFDVFYTYDTGMEKLTGKGLPNDKLMLEKTIDVVDATKPFLCYYMTYTGHLPYNTVIYDDLFQEYCDKVVEKYGDKYSSFARNYIAKNMYLEEGLKELLLKLEEKGILDDTVICMAPDHYPYGLKNNDEMTDVDLIDLYGTEDIVAAKELLDKTYPILWCGSLENDDKEYRKDVDKVTCSIDLTPTLLNLFGIDFDSRLYPGRDVFSNAEGIAIYQDGRYVTLDGIHRVLLWGNNNLSELDKYVLNSINYCKFNLKEDYYSYINHKEKKDIKFAYLTFEGGPTENTEKIVNVLKENNVNASFIVTGDKNLSLITEIVYSGNTIGIYSSFSDENLMYTSEEGFVNAIYKLYNDVNSIIKNCVKFMRFPGGSNNPQVESDNPGLMKKLKAHVAQMRLAYLDWNVDSGDEYDIGKDEIVNNIRNGIKGKNEVWIRLHDDENSNNTVEALKEIIDLLKENDFKMRAWDTYSHEYHFN